MDERKIRCPVHKNLLGKVKLINGSVNITIYCKKCKKEHIITIEEKKDVDIKYNAC